MALATARWIGNVLLGQLRQRQLPLEALPPASLAALVRMELQGKVSLLTGKKVLKLVLDRQALSADAAATGNLFFSFSPYNGTIQYCLLDCS